MSNTIFYYKPIAGQEGLDVADAVIHFLNQAKNDVEIGNFRDALENLGSMGHELKAVDFNNHTERSKIQQITVCSKATIIGWQMALGITHPTHHSSLVSHIQWLEPFVKSMEFRLDCLHGIMECEKKIAERKAQETNHESKKNDEATA